MLCLYCGTPLAIMRMLANGSFCCDEHRNLYQAQHPAHDQAGEAHSQTEPGESVPPVQSPQAVLPPEPVPQPANGSLRNLLTAVSAPVDSAPPRATLSDLAPPPARTSVDRRWRPVDAGNPIKPAFALIAPTSKFTAAKTWPAVLFNVPTQLRGPKPRPPKRAFKAAVTAADFNAKPLIPELNIQPLRPDQAKVQISPKEEQPAPVDLLRDSNPIDFSSQRLREIWRRAPGDLKLIALVIPLILLLTLNAAGPRLYARPVSIKAGVQPIFDGLLSRNWNALRKTISHRAGYDYIDDFRSGLDAWTLAGVEPRWAYDNVGFVRPGGLALYRPTAALADYHVQFSARIDEKALGFAFRAIDTRNYEAVRFIVNKAGPLPEIHVVRYTVKDGREGPKTEKTLAVPIRSETFFDVRLEVNGSDFTLMVEDKVADSWSDERLKTGGIGFFCVKGEQARVRRVEVSYQNDTLGRLCAYFSGNDSDGS